MSFTFRQFLEVKNPPWEGLDYYVKQAQNLRNLEEKLVDFQEYWDKAVKLIKDFYGSHNPWTELDYVIPHKITNLSNGDLSVPAFNSKSTYSSRLKDIVDSLPHYRKDYYQQTRMLQSIIRPIETDRADFKKNNKEFFVLAKELKKKVPEVLKSFEDQQEYFKGGKYADEDYPTYEEGRKLVVKSVEGIASLVKYALIIFDIKDKTEAWIDRRDLAYEKQFSRDVKLPKHKPQEVLYHATVSISAIQREGIKNKKESGVEGLGGGSSDLISFTSSFRLAKEIAVALKELILISKGQIKYQDILQWAKQNKLDIEKLEHMTKMNSGSMDSPEDKTINLYRHYLFMAGEVNLRYNPVFWGAQASKYKNINPNDVGVIAAMIDMNKVKEFLGAEEEFRVPSDAVLKIVKVFRF